MICSKQLGYRRQRSRLAALELNTEALLKICIPSQVVWDRLGWRGQRVTNIITQIVDQGLPALKL